MKKLLLVLCISFFSNASLGASGYKLKAKESQLMKLSSSSFEANKRIPKKFTCEGQDISPQLQWSNMPEKAKTLALICDDPDAPGEKPWVHWVVYNLPVTVTSLQEGASIKSLGGQEGVNDFGKSGYGGPCPPQGHGPHKYVFTLYALDIKLNLSDGAIKEQFLQTAQGHTIQEAQLIGLYERS